MRWLVQSIMERTAMTLLTHDEYWDDENAQSTMLTRVNECEICCRQCDIFDLILLHYNCMVTKCVGQSETLIPVCWWLYCLDFTTFLIQHICHSSDAHRSIHSTSLLVWIQLKRECVCVRGLGVSHTHTQQLVSTLSPGAIEYHVSSSHTRAEPQINTRLNATH